jgi:hypothetical protein
MLRECIAPLEPLTLIFAWKHISFHSIATLLQDSKHLLDPIELGRHPQILLSKCRSFLPQLRILRFKGANTAGGTVESVGCVTHGSGSLLLLVLKSSHLLCPQLLESSNFLRMLSLELIYFLRVLSFESGDTLGLLGAVRAGFQILWWGGEEVEWRNLILGILYRPR